MSARIASRSRVHGPPGRRDPRRVVALLVAVLAVVLTGCGAGTEQASSLAAPDPSGLHGVRPEAPYPRPVFTLTDTSGHAYDFAARTAGHPTLLFFGYTMCPDECPTAMADAAAAVRKAGAAGRAVDVVFVTTDPRRDTRTVLRRWLDRFDESFVGLTGTPAQLAAAQQAAHIPPATDTPGGPNGYTVAHSSLLLGYGANDRARVVYPPGAKVSDIAADLTLLAEKDPTT